MVKTEIGASPPVTKQVELSQKLQNLPDDKSRVKVLLDTIFKENDGNQVLESRAVICFALGYLEALLERHGLWSRP